MPYYKEKDVFFLVNGERTNLQNNSSSYISNIDYSKLDVKPIFLAESRNEYYYSQHICNQKYNLAFTYNLECNIVHQNITVGVIMADIQSSQIISDINFSPMVSPELGCQLVISRDEELVYNNNKHSSCDIIVDGKLSYDQTSDLTLITSKNIIFKKYATLTMIGKATLYLKSGIKSPYLIKDAAVMFNERDKQIFLDEGKLIIQYNPKDIDATYKYNNMYFYNKHINKPNQADGYMLINDISDLQNTRAFLSGRYALANDIDATRSEKFHEGLGFMSISSPLAKRPFVGDFDGNGFTIKNLNIDCRDYNYSLPFFNGCGLFGNLVRAEIKDFTIDHCNIKGDHYVGALFGTSHDSEIKNVTVKNCVIQARAVLGAVAGEAENVKFSDIKCYNNTLVATECIGAILGAATKVNLDSESCDCNIDNYPLIGAINMNPPVYDDPLTGLVNFIKAGQINDQEEG